MVSDAAPQCNGRRIAEALPERLLHKIEFAGGCWLWKAARDQFGYGRVTVNYRRMYAHRYIYELLAAPIPAGLTIDHLCGVKACVNPAHLEVVTRAVNILRGGNPAAVNARKTHCKRGHPLDGDNLIERLQPNGQVRRICRTCLGNAYQLYGAPYRARRKSR